jgi:hypothetical protein
MAASCVGVNGHFDRWELDAARRVQKLVHLVVCSRESIVKCVYLNILLLGTQKIISTVSKRPAKKIKEDGGQRISNLRRFTFLIFMGRFSAKIS